MDGQPQDGPARARDWVKVLAQYRDPDEARSWRELAVTLGPFLVLWALAWVSLDGPRIVTLVIAAVLGLFLMRLFALQHDCGHAALFKDRRVNDWVGRVLGVLTLSFAVSAGRKAGGRRDEQLIETPCHGVHDAEQRQPDRK